jgi:hypothetical protein
LRPPGRRVAPTSRRPPPSRLEADDLAEPLVVVVVVVVVVAVAEGEASTVRS